MKLSIVVIAYNMDRELPRTIRSLLPPLQKGISADDYEIIVIDNGSAKPPREADYRRWGGNVVVHVIDHPHPSPVQAVNHGLALAKGALIGVWFDGARLATPGLLAGALQGALLHQRPVIATHNFVLGPDFQRISAGYGYDQAYEDRLLASVNWAADPYRLFDIGSFGFSSARGWFKPPIESNGLFLTATHWRELGGFDPAFDIPGGGLAIADIWVRACGSADTQPIVLLGEGTFHQIHGGTSASVSAEEGRRFMEQYIRIRGQPFERPRIDPIYIGRLHSKALPSVAWAAGDYPGPVWHGPLAMAERRGIEGRPFGSALGLGAMSLVEQGTAETRYRDKPLGKSPFDIGLYLHLLSNLRPGTVFQIGTDDPGAAVWFADILAALGVPRGVITISSDSSPDSADPRIHHIQGDTMRLEALLSAEDIRSLARPFLVIESGKQGYDASLDALRFFDRYVEAGDYVVIERGIASQLPGARNLAFGDGPNRAIADFLKDRGDAYEIDVSLCDLYGHNVTGSPNGWLRRR